MKFRFSFLFWSFFFLVFKLSVEWFFFNGCFEIGLGFNVVVYVRRSFGERVFSIGN